MAPAEPLRFPVEPVPPAAPLAPADFLSGAPEDRARGLLAFALALEAGDASSAETIVARREEADRLLTEDGFRRLHNRIEEIGRNAVLEHLGNMRQPPGFITLIVANIAGLVLVGALFLLAMYGIG
jgi:hypothetical protein